MLCSSLRISGHLPAPIVNGGGDRFWKWKEFKLSRARDLDPDLGSGHTAYRRASLIDLYLYTKFHWNRRNFLWTDGRTDGHHIFPPLILLGRLLEVDLKMKLGGCIDGERQFKTAKRSQAPGDVTVLKRFFHDNLSYFFIVDRKE